MQLQIEREKWERWDKAQAERAVRLAAEADGAGPEARMAALLAAAAKEPWASRPAVKCELKGDLLKEARAFASLLKRVEASQTFEASAAGNAKLPMHIERGSR